MQVKKMVLINALVSTAFALSSSNTLAAANTLCPVINAQQQISLKSKSEPCADINIKATDRLITAIRFSEHGLHSEAQKELTEVIKANPNIKFSKESIDSITEKKQGQLGKIEKQLSSVTAILNFVNSLLIPLAVALVLTNAIGFYFKQRSKIPEVLNVRSDFS